MSRSLSAISGWNSLQCTAGEGCCCTPVPTRRACRIVQSRELQRLRRAAAVSAAAALCHAVAVTGWWRWGCSWHLGQLQVGLSRAKRLVQCSHARITLSDTMPMQVPLCRRAPPPCVPMLAPFPPPTPPPCVPMLFPPRRCAPPPYGCTAAPLDPPWESSSVMLTADDDPRSALVGRCSALPALLPPAAGTSAACPARAAATAS